MKRILIALILSLAIITAGCAGSTFEYKVADGITGIPINGPALVNGHKTFIKNGIVSANSSKITIEKTGYKTASFDSQKTIMLMPVAYLAINAVPTPNEIYIDGKSEKMAFKDNTIVISPMPLGSHTVSFKGKLTAEKTISIDIKKGENRINVKLPFDKQKIANYISQLKFPNEFKNAAFAIKINGTLDGENVNYVLDAEVKNGELFKVSDENITYYFKNGVPFIEKNGKETEVSDKEKIAALEFAKSVIEKILTLRDYIKPLAIENISQNEITFFGKRTFEKRPFNEEITLYFKDNSINKSKIHITSEIENADITTEIDVIGEG